MVTEVERNLREGSKVVDMYVSLGMADCLVFDCTNLRVAASMLLEFAVKFSEGKPVVMSIYSEGGKMLCIDVRHQARVVVPSPLPLALRLNPSLSWVPRPPPPRPPPTRPLALRRTPVAWYMVMCMLNGT